MSQTVGSNELNPGPLTVSLHDLTNFLWIDESVLQIGKHQLVRLRDIEPKSQHLFPLDFLPHFEHIHRAGIHRDDPLTLFSFGSLDDQFVVKSCGQCLAD